MDKPTVDEHGIIMWPKGWSLSKVDREYEKMMRKAEDNYPQWARDLLSKIDKAEVAFKRLATVAPIIKRMKAERLAKSKRQLASQSAFYGRRSLLPEYLYGDAPEIRELHKSNDLTMGAAGKQEEYEDRVTKKVVELAGEAHTLGLGKVYRKVLSKVLEYLKNADADKGLKLRTLEDFADQFKQALDEHVKKPPKDGSVTAEELDKDWINQLRLRVSPVGDGEPPKRPTTDEEDEEDTSPMAEE